MTPGKGLFGKLATDVAECSKLPDGPQRDQCFINKGFRKVADPTSALGYKWSRQTGPSLPDPRMLLPFVPVIGGIVSTGLQVVDGLKSGNPRVPGVASPVPATMADQEAPPSPAVTETAPDATSAPGMNPMLLGAAMVALVLILRK